MIKQVGRDTPLSATPTLSAISDGPGKGNLIDRIFPSPAQRVINKEHRIERRADNKINRENNQLDRRANRDERAGQRQSRRSCKGGSCGGRALGFVGYN